MKKQQEVNTEVINQNKEVLKFMEILQDEYSWMSSELASNIALRIVINKENKQNINSKLTNLESNI